VNKISPKLCCLVISILGGLFATNGCIAENISESAKPPNIVVNDYIRRMSNPYSGEVKEKEIISVENDINSDGANDYLLYDIGNVGSSGCCGVAYLKIKIDSRASLDGYCFAGEVEISIVKDKDKNLTCK